MTVKKTCQYGKFRSFEHLLFLFVEELVDCYWMDGGYTCDVAEPSIMFVNNVTRYLKLSIRNAGTKDVGRYLCQRVQQGQPDPVSCPFSLTGWCTLACHCGIVQFVWCLDTGPLISVAGGVWVFTVELCSLFCG